MRHALIAERPTLGVYFESRPEIISLIVRRLLDLGLRMRQSPHQAELIHQAVSGDPAAIGEIFDSYGDAIYLVAHRLMTCPEDAEDVVQDVFLGLSKALSTYEDRGSLEGWLKKVAARTALMRLREHRRRTNLFRRYGASLPRVSKPSIDEKLSLDDALAVLPESLRLVMVLKLEGYSHDEIGKFLGIGRSASKMRYLRACRRIRGLLDDQ